MTFGPLDTAFFVGYLIIIVGIGLWVSRNRKGVGKTAQEYFLADRALPWWVIGSSLIASNIAYAMSNAAPACYKIEQASGGTGYVGVAQLVSLPSSRKVSWTGAINASWDTNTLNWTTNGVAANAY